MSEINIYERFPEMQPVQSAPPLSAINGIGFAMHGSRDSDAETGTYVKTHCFTLIFVPILALRAYRVANAPTGGWYFIGRVPLSGVAKLWNLMLATCLVSLGIGLFWHHYFNTPEYIAGRKLTQADDLAKAGQVGKAAELCREVVEGKTSHAAAARDKLRGYLDDAVTTAAPDEAASAFKIAVELQTKPGPDKRLFDQGMKVVGQHADSDPRGAAVVLNAVAPVAPDRNAVLAKGQELWERVVKQQPSDYEAASQLALVYEGQNELAKCEPLLTPHAKRLGLSEGARILGHLYVEQGKLEEAYELLQPYVDGRLPKLRAAEKAAEDAVRSLNERLSAKLNKEQVSDFPINRYKTANEAGKDQIWREYVISKLPDDVAYKKAQQAIERESSVVPVAIDLGIVQLRRGQGLADQKMRQAELEKAEKTFLAIRGRAGDTDAYRLFLGQVYYWLGKPGEGRKLFDELMESQKKRFETVIGVSRLLREVGATTEARLLAEEAFNGTDDAAKKQQAAVNRALLGLDMDDQILWLRRGNQADPDVKALLSGALGAKAVGDGKEEEAAGHLRECITLYEKQPPSSSSFNNAALACMDLFRVTGEAEALDKGRRLFEKALALQPSDSVVLGNTADSLEESALRDIMAGSLDFTKLRSGGDVELLSYLYQDQASRERLLQRLRKHAGLAKARAYYERLLVLAPKSGHAYWSLNSLHWYAHDLEGLRGLLRRLESVELDTADIDRKTLDGYAGKEDDKLRPETKARYARWEAILKTARKGKPDATLAVALTRLAQAKMAMALLDLPADADEIVALAEEAHAAAPSSGTHANLRTALLHRAHRALTQQQPDYAAMAARAKQSLDPSYLVAVAASRDEKLRQAVLANKDVQRVLPLLKEQFARFPDAPSEFGWVLLRAAGAAEAEPMAKALKNEMEQLERTLVSKLWPLNAGSAIQAYWAYQAIGDEAKGLEVLKQCAARGVPMPFDP